MARPATRERLARLLSMVPWIASQPDPPAIAEVCDRFGLTAKELRADLNTVFVVGVYPHEPGDLVDVFMDDDDDGVVAITYNNHFEDALRLTVDEALAVLVAGAGAGDSAAPDGPLERAMAKVRVSLGVTDDDDLAVVLPVDREVTAVMEHAIAECRVVSIRYFTPGRNETTERTIEPHRTFLAGGYTYVQGYCRSSADERSFRFDRILDADLGDDTFVPPADGSTDLDRGDLDAFAMADDVPRVTLRLPADADWVVEAYPNDSAELGDDGRWSVTLAVASKEWLETLWLRLGPAVDFVAGPPEWADAGPVAAARMLQRVSSPGR